MRNVTHLYVPVYALTLLMSAFLLFGVQPMFGKMVLPLLGGAPAVWNTAMVFFQAVLLAGYGYAHLSARILPLKGQAALHFALLVFFLFVLPIHIPDGWEPPAESGNPAFWQIGLMTVAVGGPFFVLSGCAPLFQHWFSRSGHKDAHNPYFLYAASNLGSMTALLTYPFLTEPLLTLPQQSAAWAGGYTVLIAMAVLCAALVWNRAREIQEDTAPAPPPVWKMRLYWIILALIPSSLMLGVTTYITTDLAAVPLLWIMPLALYVGTFIIVFAQSFRIPPGAMLLIHAVLLTVAFISFIHPVLPGKIWLIPLHLSLFFISALICHQALADTRPHASHLTEFYLLMSLGGVLGGILNALVAPVLFPLPVEYAAALAAVCFIRHANQKNAAADLRENWWAMGGAAVFGLLTLFVAGQNAAILICITAIAGFLLYMQNRRWAFALTMTALLALYPGFNWLTIGKLLYIERNFFGVSRVYDAADGETRMYLHGMTNHGAQPLTPEQRLTPITYFYPGASVGDIFRVLDQKPFPQKIAVLGLGIGSLVCYPHEGRHFDLFEIDPAVKKIAEDKTLFTFLSGCGSPYDIILGDGRLQIAKMPDASYDAIILDAFSSDNIPVHIITKEAFEIYLRKLKPGGIIISNISNNFLNLAPVLAAMAEDTGLHVLFKISLGGTIEGTSIPYASSIFAVLARKEEHLGALSRTPGWRAWRGKNQQRAWTDDYASVVKAFWPHGHPELCMESGVPYHCAAPQKE